MCEGFEWLNAEHMGEDNVFPTKNGAPKILEQFKYKPYTLEFCDEFTMAISPNHCSQLMQYIIMANLPLVKCLNTLLAPHQW